MTTTTRSLKYLRKSGHIACSVEKWLPRMNIRKDAFGFADLLASHPNQTGAILVQCTVGGESARRVSKIIAIKEARKWLRSKNRIVVHAWSKKGPRGARKLWVCRETEITPQMFS